MNLVLRFGDNGISFDFEKDEFKTILCQGFFVVANSYLIDLRGCLVGMVNLSLSTHIEILKLMYYLRNQWVREYCINLVPNVEIKVVGLTAEDEIVLVRYYYSDNEDAAAHAAGEDAADEGAAAPAPLALEDVSVGDGSRRAVLLAYNSKAATLWPTIQRPLV